MGDERGLLSRLLTAAAPGLILFSAVLLMITPLKVFGHSVPLPLAPFIVIFLYAAYAPNALPAPITFAAGLLQDLLFASPLGLWATVFLSLHYAVLAQHDYLKGRLHRVIAVLFAMLVAAVGAILWGLSSLVFAEVLPVRPLAVQLLVTILMYPACAYVFLTVRRSERGPSPA
ncbi:hypothetical protein PB2503_01012 [Parvularcula bermudensis HTCC2503]|uniref:Rod shape-determining protein MreD n=2 Tax=Parvularcula TaxID=208215 RepID=E0TB79_PARBH|nr:hypothetical protein PB2503_01012 [Parvularcula bermudensis HTCC2503]